MQKFIKIFLRFVIMLIIMISVLIFTFLIVGKLYEKGILKYHYNYIESIEYKDVRYSLYDNKSWDGNMWVIFEHDLEYTNYKKVERSQVALYIYNNNPNDRYINHFFWDYSRDYNSSLKLHEDRYLVLYLNGANHFLYDIEKDIKHLWENELN